MTPAAIWEALKKVPGWIWLLLAGLAFGFAYVEQEKARARRQVNDARDKEAAEVQAEVVSQITENTHDVIREADAVRSLPAARELPDGSATLEEHHYRDKRRRLEGSAVRDGQGDPDLSR